MSTNTQVKKTNWLLVFALIMAAFTPTFASTSRAVILPTVLGGFNAMGLYALILISGQVASSISTPIAGKLSDLLGRKPVFIVGLLGYTATMVLIALSFNAYMLAFGIFASGIFYGFLASLVKVCLVDAVPEEKIPQVQSWVDAAGNATMLVAPIVAGIFCDTVGWQLVYWVTLPLLAIVAVIVLARMPKVERDPNLPKPSIDFKGTILFTTAVLPLLIVLSISGSTIAWFSPAWFAMMAVSVISFILLIIVEGKTENPMISIYLFKSGTFTKVFLIATFVYAGYNVVQYYSVYMQNVMGVSAAVSGTLLTPKGIAGIVGAMAIGAYVGKTKNYKMGMILQLVMLIVSFGVYLTMGENSPSFMFIIISVLCGIGMSGIFICAYPFIMGAVERKDIGAAITLVSAGMTLGSSIGSALGGPLLNMTWNKAASLIPAELQAAVSPEHYTALLNQATLKSADTLSAIRATLDAGVQGVFDTTVSSLRALLMSGINKVTMVALGCAVAALFLSLALQGKKKA